MADYDYIDQLYKNAGSVGEFDGDGVFKNKKLSQKLAQIESDYNKIEEPKADFMSKMILSFAPAIAGAVGGESAALAAPVAQKQATDLYNEGLKEQKQSADARKKALMDQYNKLSAIGAKQDALEQQGELKRQELESRAEIAKGNQDVRRALAEAALERQKEASAKRAADAESKQDSKDIAALNEHLSKGWAGRSGQTGKVQEKINNAEYAKGLIEQGRHQEGGLDSRQVEELAQSTARMLGGGAQASSRVEALVPKTFFGKAQSFKEWISNKPTGQQMQAFVDRMEETIDREKSIAENQKRTFQVEGLPRFSRLKKSNPDAYYNALKSRGLDDSMVDENGKLKQADQPSSGFSDEKAKRLQELRAKAAAGKLGQ